MSLKRIIFVCSLPVWIPAAGQPSRHQNQCRRNLSIHEAKSGTFSPFSLFKVSEFQSLAPSFWCYCQALVLFAYPVLQFPCSNFRVQFPLPRSEISCSAVEFAANSRFQFHLPSYQVPQSLDRNPPKHTHKGQDVLPSDSLRTKKTRTIRSAHGKRITRREVLQGAVQDPVVEVAGGGERRRRRRRRRHCSGLVKRSDHRQCVLRNYTRCAVLFSGKEASSAQTVCYQRYERDVRLTISTSKKSKIHI